MPALKLKIAGIICTPPILESVIETSDKIFQVDWSYDGVDYTSDNTTSVQLYYSINGGTTFNIAAPAVSYPGTEVTVDFTEIPSEVFHFKVKLVNRTCNEESNVINYTI